MRPLVKIHGGKAYLHKWIISRFPTDYEQHLYVEPCIGGGSILLNKLRSIIEIINDANFGLYKLWHTVIYYPEKLESILSLTNYNEATFESAKTVLQEKDKPYDQVLRAAAEYVVRRMSRGGLMKDFAWSDRLRGGKPGDANAFATAVHQIPEIAKRIHDVLVFNRDCLELLKGNNQANVFTFIDPPYLHSTRVSKSAYGLNEMTDQEHDDLVCFLASNFKGKFMISGYDNQMYNSVLKQCNTATKSIVNHSSQSRTKRKKEEKIWMNY